jgi:hypothetical protein
MITIIFILICYGACNNMIYGSIFEGFRTLLSKFGTGGYSLHKLFTCFMCLGTWVGFLLSFVLMKLNYLNITPVGSLGINEPYLVIFLNGLVSAAGVWLTHTLQEFMERIGVN